MEIKYKKLTNPRRRHGFSIATASRASLWLGDDHLLSVNSTGYTESYKRFYFQDIQAFVFHRSNRAMIYTIILGILIAPFLFALIYFLNVKGVDAIGASIFLGIVVGILGTLLVINLILGTRCKTFIQTAVQTEELPSLSRVRQTRKALEKIRPLILAAQGGQLSPEVLAARMAELAAPPPVPDKFNVPPLIT